MGLDAAAPAGRAHDDPAPRYRYHDGRRIAARSLDRLVYSANASQWFRSEKASHGIS